jgi:hypothetical protein
LIEACAQRAGELGAPVLLWETAPDNRRAQAAYARTGATASSWLEYELELGVGSRTVSARAELVDNGRKGGQSAS